jgi:ABC-2 type transport system permease protein
VTTSGIGPLGEQLVARLDAEQGVILRRYSTEHALVRAVERGGVLAGLVVPPGYDRRLRAGDRLALAYYARPDSLAPQLRVSVQAAVSGQSALVRAAHVVAREQRVPFAAGLARARAAAAVVPEVSVRVTAPDGKPYPAARGRFDLGASSQLILFVFLTGLSGAVALVETRRFGISRRMLSTPTGVRTVVVGETLGRFAIALVQGAIIMLGSLLLFSVNWGNPAAAALLLVAISLVGAGSGMLLGSLVGNDQQAGALGLMLSLGLAALGGCMIPLEVFPPVMRTVAHVTPQAWGIDAFGELIRHGGGLRDVLGELAILFGYAVALVVLGAAALRRTLTSY